MSTTPQQKEFKPLDISNFLEDYALGVPDDISPNAEDFMSEDFHHILYSNREFWIQKEKFFHHEDDKELTQYLVKLYPFKNIHE